MRRLAWKSAIWLLIASAVLVSIGRLLAPYADLLRPQVERLMSERLGVPVRIERIEASWPRFSPRLSLRGVRVGTARQQLLGVNRARIEFRLYNALRPAANVYELVVLGLDVSVVQDAQGRWSWRLDRGGRLDEGWLETLSAGDIVLRDAGVRLAPHGLPEARWSIPEALLRRSGDELGVRLEARPEVGRGERLTGRARIRLVDGRMQAFEGHARVPTLAPDAILPTPSAAPPGYLAAGQAWLLWRRAEGARARARLVLRPDDEATAPGPGMLTLDAHWQPGALHARLDAERRPGEGEAPVRSLVVARTDAGFAVEAEHAELGYLHALLAPWLAGRPNWPETIDGTVRDLRWRWLKAQGPVAAAGAVSDLSLQLADPALSVAGVDLALGLGGDELRLELAGAPVVSLPMLYPDERAFRRIRGTLGLREGRLRFDGVRVEHDEFDVRIDGSIQATGDGPFFDVVIDTPRVTPASPRRWLPRRGLPRKTRNWLEDALLAVDEGRAVTALFGRPGRWLERVAPGSVNSDIEVRGLRLAYAEGWPVAEQVAGRLEFVGESMRGVAERGRVAGVPLSAPRVRIANMRRAELELTVESPEVDAAGLARLADALPLPGADAALAAMDWSGRASAAARVWFPVRHARDWRLVGEIEFGDASVRFPELALRLDALGGVLPFSRQRLGPGRVRGRAGGEPIRIALDGRFRPAFRMTVAGRGRVPEILPGTWKARAPFLAADLAGVTDFDLRFERLGEGGDAPLGLTISSDLAGVASSLPAPLDKAAADARDLTLTLPLGDALEPARIGYDGLVDAVWLRAGDYWQLGIGLGGTTASLPTAENFIVEGRLPRLAVAAWAGRIGRALAGGVGGDRQQRVDLSGWLDLRVDDLRVAAGSLGGLDAALNREGEYWRLNLLGPRVQGSVRIPAGEGAERSLIVDLERLHWPAGDADSTPRARPSLLDPGIVPPFDIAIRSLRRGELDLGEFRLNSHRDGSGIAIEQVTSRRDGFELNGSGGWYAGEDGPYSRMRLRWSARDLGRTLTDAGFDIALQRGNAVVEMQGRWPGTPLELSLARFDGEIELVISDGAIPAASPGAGRVLGLVSLNSIPRRLRLDFTDVFGQGLAFDRVAGRFDVDDGVAQTDDLRIDAPAAEIRMRGRTDLRERTYDQTMTVRPGVGSALPIIGAVAGGPVGAAAGAALQQIFAEPLKGISEVRYAVDGSWESPRIRPIAVEPAESAGG